MIRVLTQVPQVSKVAIVIMGSRYGIFENPSSMGTPRADRIGRWH